MPTEGSSATMLVAAGAPLAAATGAAAAHAFFFFPPIRSYILLMVNPELSLCCHSGVKSLKRDNLLLVHPNHPVVLDIR